MTRTILLIDDSPSVRTLMRGALERENFSVVDAGDGEEAMDKLDGQPFGLIVSDLAMPRMDGLSFLRWLRVHPRYKFTPLLILTTETRKKVKESARQMGAQGILAKPCTPTQLVTAVQRLCR
ncbi:MAG: response regulator [Betaproteobacteria bacterium]|jgi:two-component system chemotaxis response regulator CheY|uniref:response regulator n=1 Tax=Silanimonas sp. TaxID=1929290 RepID=UPI0022C0CB67|nr:response regulator [Silanimonas sp.]MCZ8111524.1 response regulator [Rubrivivax sp.]MCZ8166926.1 response regulator [Silanimonas sp.]